MNIYEQLTKLSVKKKALVLFLLVTIIGAAFWFIYFSPMQSELESLKDRHATLLRERENANSRKATYEKDRKRRDELKKRYGQQLRALPSETEMSSFLDSLNTQAEAVGLEIKSVKPKKEVAAKYYARIPVELKLIGTYHQLAKFFYLVGSLDRIINIEDISLNLDNFVDSTPLISANVMATTFRAISSKERSKKNKEKGGSR